ncbi:MAG TPA: hypothetical protein VK625_10340, partial [Flavitalea sp.]|nr:hypothetical protein [Flavitalea sp.]
KKARLSTFIVAKVDRKRLPEILQSIHDYSEKTNRWPIMHVSKVFEDSRINYRVFTVMATGFILYIFR